MAWTQADIDKLQAALASGVKRVMFEGPPRREVEYQSLGEMRELLAEMNRQVNGVTTRRLTTHERGFR